MISEYTWVSEFYDVDVFEDRGGSYENTPCHTLDFWLQ